MKKRVLRFLPKILSATLSHLFPYLVSMTIYFIFLDIRVYPGFSRKIILLPIPMIVLLVLGLGFINVIVSKKKRGFDINSTVFYLNRLLLPAVICFYFLLSYAEQQNYPNYVFSTYKIHVYPFQQLLAFMMGLIFIDVCRVHQQKVKPFVLEKLFVKQPTLKNPLMRIKWEMWFIVVIACCLSLTMFRNIMELFRNLSNTYPHILSHPLATYEEKNRFILNDYDFFMFLKTYSTENAVIAIPPQQAPWLTSGNGGYVRYFTYPKHVINSPLKGSFPPEATHVMISKGEWPVDEADYGWPKTPVEAKRIWYFDRETSEVTLSSETIFDPTTHKYSWGLIELEQ